MRGVPLGVDIVNNPENRRLYDIWKAIKARTGNPKNSRYKWYGARGIRCEFLDFHSFYHHIRSLSGYSLGMWLDRADNNAGYAPGNLRWVPPLQQQRNKRSNRKVSYLGREMALSEFATTYCPKVAYGVVYYRLINCRWCPDKVIALAVAS